MTRSSALAALAGVLILLGLCEIVVTLALAQAGRNQTVASLRAGCYRTASRNVAFVNGLRADATANHIVATDRFQSARTRDARSAEVWQELAAIRVIETQTDAGYWRQLHTRQDRLAIRHGGFTCIKAYPRSGLIP